MPGKGCKKRTKKGKKTRKHTPITSKRQQSAMGVAYAAKKGEISPSKLRGPARKMYESMTKKDLKAHLEEAGGKKLPKRVKKRKGSKGAKRGTMSGSWA